MVVVVITVSRRISLGLRSSNESSNGLNEPLLLRLFPDPNALARLDNDGPLTLDPFRAKRGYTTGILLHATTKSISSIAVKIICARASLILLVYLSIPEQGAIVFGDQDLL